MYQTKHAPLYLCGLAAARVSGHHHHLVVPQRLYDLLPPLVDGQVLLVRLDLLQLAELLLLHKVQVVQQDGAELLQALYCQTLF